MPEGRSIQIVYSVTLFFLPLRQRHVSVSPGSVGQFGIANTKQGRMLRLLDFLDEEAGVGISSEPETEKISIKERRRGAHFQTEPARLTAFDDGFPVLNPAGAPVR